MDFTGPDAFRRGHTFFYIDADGKSRRIPKPRKRDTKRTCRRRTRRRLAAGVRRVV